MQKGKKLKQKRVIKKIIKISMEVILLIIK
jgi:hypothetical protein